MDRAGPTAVAVGEHRDERPGQACGEDGAGTVAGLFLRQAAARPEAEAVVHRDERLSYAALAGRAGAVSALLVAAGLRPGDRVAVCLPRGTDLLVGLLAVWRAGGVYLPIDPSSPDERIAETLDDAGPRVLLTRHGLAERVLRPGAAAPAVVDLDGSGAGTGPVDAVWPGPGDTAYVVYTSGSTGRPKGVEVGHAALHNVVLELTGLLESGPGNTWMSMASAGFDISMAEFCVPLGSGARLVVPSAEDLRDPHALTGLVARESVDRMQAVPSQWRVLLEAGFDRPGTVAMVGGEALPPALAVRLRAAVGSLVNGYGPTETTVLSTVWRVPRDPDRVRIGRPVAGTRLYLLDDQGRDVPPGAVGELWIGGVGVAEGYLGRPGLTAERFLPEPEPVADGGLGAPAAHGRMYRTGDLCRMDPDGDLEYLARADDQLKVRGHRIEPGEIELCLAGCPGVAQVAVAVSTQPGGVDALTAYVVADGPEPPTRDALRARAAERLPRAYVPDLFVFLDAMPLTPNGKTDRGALAATAVRGAVPTDAGPAGSGDGFAARVCAICAEALGVPSVSLDDDLFELGAQSLTFMRISAMLKTGVDSVVPVHLLYEATSVREIVDAAGEARSAR